MIEFNDKRASVTPCWIRRNSLYKTLESIKEYKTSQVSRLCTPLSSIHFSLFQSQLSHPVLFKEKLLTGSSKSNWICFSFSPPNTGVRRHFRLLPRALHVLRIRILHVWILRYPSHRNICQAVYIFRQGTVLTINTWRRYSLRSQAGDF